ncbi:hypothetical protein EDB19DRAFT_1923927 [Suillus lakei]|nr:hypothetical protein EDB19DRAFT_1923927 [Suillus lakei]
MKPAFGRTPEGRVLPLREEPTLLFGSSFGRVSKGSGGKRFKGEKEERAGPDVTTPDKGFGAYAADKSNSLSFVRLIFDYIFSFFFSALLNLCPLFLSFSPFTPALSSFSPLKRFPPLPFETLPKEDPKEERRFLPQREDAPLRRAPLP